jgi:cysteine-rich repeat protein
MPLNTVPFTGLNRLAILVTLALPLACFKGDDGDPPAEDDNSSSETDDTEGTCDVATIGCPCTAGGGCNPGLECLDDNTCGPITAECGNGQVESDESCDDGNGDNTDSCTTLCAPPSCSDGIVSGDEVDVDCGMEACGVGCDFGQNCSTVADCEFPSCGPGPGAGDNSICQLPTSCSNWLANNGGATDNIYAIDPDGAAGPIPEMDVFCHMSKDGGGWTLVFVASDDDVDTWTWNNRAKLAGEAEPVGTLASLNLDFMSPAYNNLPFTDLLFIHQPSNVWAHYGGVGDGISTSIADVVMGTASPVCDFNLGDNGHALIGGTLTASGDLCDTDLYFNLGDHEATLADCMNFGSASNSATFGPVWSADNGEGCPFDDPAEFGLGPQAPCGFCPGSFPMTEFDFLGYGNALSLNTGTKKVGENYMQMYVR